MGKLNPLRVGALVAALALIILAGYAGVKYTMAYFFPEVWDEDSEAVEDGLPPDQMNLLLLGIDARKGESMTRADSIIFVHADTTAQKVALMSIPRDTRVEIPGRGKDKINATTIYGGPDMAREVVSELLGVPVPYHVLVDFEGFKEIVDILGGVTIDVEERMYYRDPRDTPPLVIDLHPGVQRLDGENAMGFVRYRGDALADIARTQRQQQFVMALADEMLKPKTILKLPKLIPELNRNIETNLSLKNMVKWAGMARKVDNLNMISATLPGTFWDNRGISYWYVDPDHAKVAFADLVAGKPIVDPIDLDLRPPTPVAAPKPKPKDPEPTPVETEAPEDTVVPGPPDGERGDGTPPAGDAGPADDPPAAGSGEADDSGIPDWTPVDENHRHHAPYDGRSTGAGMEYGSLPDEGAALGG